MSTAAQLAANKANAQHSCGPTTGAGKAISSRNHFRHGFTGAFTLLPSEDPDQYDHLLQSLQAEHQPATPTENVLVERLAQYQWLVQRALHLQGLCFNEHLEPAEHHRSLALYLRYQTTHERAFSRSLNDLLRLRSERRKQEIGFESQKQKEAQELRRQQLHEARLRLVNSKADHIEIDNDIRQTIEAPLPGHMRLPFDTLKTVFATAVDQVNRDLKAEMAA